MKNQLISIKSPIRKKIRNTSPFRYIIRNKSPPNIPTKFKFSVYNAEHIPPQIYNAEHIPPPPKYPPKRKCCGPDPPFKLKLEIRVSVRISWENFNANRVFRFSSN